MLGMVMGMQSAAVRQVHLAGVWTTFITGTLTQWIAGLVERTPPKELPVGRVQAAVHYLRPGSIDHGRVAATLAPAGGRAAMAGTAGGDCLRRAADAARRLGFKVRSRIARGTLRRTRRT
ncbi:DUF1275 family protein [Frateuria terrea]|uniref:DUF1275 family protein n=1 Tax=Frateuria terrea TaxID=529704 RepID=UPI003CCBA62B